MSHSITPNENNWFTPEILQPDWLRALPIGWGICTKVLFVVVVESMFTDYTWVLIIIHVHALGVDYLIQCGQYQWRTACETVDPLPAPQEAMKKILHPPSFYVLKIEF